MSQASASSRRYELGRGDVEPRQRTDGGAQLDHRDGRLRTVPHGVPDDQTDPVARPCSTSNQSPPMRLPCPAGSQPWAMRHPSNSWSVPGSRLRGWPARYGARARNGGRCPGPRRPARPATPRPRCPRGNGARSGPRVQARKPMASPRSRSGTTRKSPLRRSSMRASPSPEAREPLGGMGVDRVEQLRLRRRGTGVGRPAGEDDHLADRQQPLPVLGRVRRDAQRRRRASIYGAFRAGVRVLLDAPTLQQVDGGRFAEPGRQRVHDMAAGQPQVEFRADDVGRGGEGRPTGRGHGGGASSVRLCGSFRRVVSFPRGVRAPGGGQRITARRRQLYDEPRQVTVR